MITFVQLFMCRIPLMTIFCKCIIISTKLGTLNFYHVTTITSTENDCLKARSRSVLENLKICLLLYGTFHLLTFVRKRIQKSSLSLRDKHARIFISPKRHLN